MITQINKPPVTTRDSGSLLSSTDLMSREQTTPSTHTTETPPPPGGHIDQLDDLAALAVMLDNQAGAIAAIRDQLPAIAAASEKMLARLQRSDAARIIYAGAGCSIRLGVQDGVELLPTFNWPVSRLAYMIAGGSGALTLSVENAEDDTASAADQAEELQLTPDDTLIGLAASGSTPFTCKAIAAGNDAGALTIGIANNPDTALLHAAQCPILLHTGAEAVAGSTRLKAGTAQKICLNLISTLTMTRLGKVRHGLMVDMVAGNDKLRQRQQRILEELKNQHD